MRHSQVQPSRPRSLRRSFKNTRVRWLLTALVAVGSVGWTVSTLTEADAAASAWGHRRTVPVATTDLEPGRVITDTDINFTSRPAALLPADVSESPVGRTVTRPIARDETVLDRRLSGGSATGSAALLDENSVAFAVPADASTPPTKVGDNITLYAPSEVLASTTRPGGPATRISDRAVVVAVSDKSITVGVTLADASGVARALLSASVIIALID